MTHSPAELAYYARLVEGLDEKAARARLGQYGRTPRQLFESLHDLGKFTLDGAACQWDAKLPRFNSAEDPDRYSWEGERVFINPPFGMAAHFARKAVEGGAAIVMAILPASLNSGWWHRYVMPHACDVFVPTKRVQFEPPPGITYSTNPRDSVLVYWCQASPFTAYLAAPDFSPCDPITGRIVRAA